jgi:hypothetical protein
MNLFLILSNHLSVNVSYLPNQAYETMNCRSSRGLRFGGQTHSHLDHAVLYDHGIAKDQFLVFQLSESLFPHIAAPSDP